MVALVSGPMKNLLDYDLPTRQTKSNKENRYVIKVMRFKQGRGRGYGSWGSAEPKMCQAFSLAINKLLYNYINPIMYGKFEIEMEYR